MDRQQASGFLLGFGVGLFVWARCVVTLRRSPYLEMGISLMTDVLVAAVMVWILFRKKACTVACCPAVCV
jgi:hypothetical protein